jgi:hypothetical protein
MKIIATTYSTVEIEDEQRHRSTVFLGDDGRWKCLGCMRRRCSHVQFVKQQNPTLPEPPPPLSDEDIADLIDVSEQDYQDTQHYMEHHYLGGE